ncbi:MAG: nuclear transport factor 2 family protein [Acidimicrobiales bacterium]|nr:nuclear transport factor 2 family protein [Acidimicrobiales bacterium]
MHDLPEPRPGTADDQAAVAAALARFAWILDHREWDHVGDVLAPDAEAYGEAGIDAVIENSLRRHLGGCGPSQHLLGNAQIEVDGDRARSIVYARVHHRGAGERSHVWWECWGEYHDTWIRTPGGWRMTSRSFDVTIADGDMSVLQPG